MRKLAHPRVSVTNSCTSSHPGLSQDDESEICPYPHLEPTFDGQHEDLPLNLIMADSPTEEQLSPGVPSQAGHILAVRSHCWRGAGRWRAP